MCKKRWLIFIMGLSCLFIALELLSNIQSQSKQEVMKIGICTYKSTDTFIASIVTELEELVKEEERQYGKTIKLDISDAKESQVIQNEQVEKYIALNYDVICINIVDRTSAAYLIDQAHQADIPLIFFNRQPVEEDMKRSEKVYYIGSNPKESARLQGELIVEAYEEDSKTIDKNQDGKIEYAILEGEAGHQDTVIRTEYAIKVLEEHGMELEKVVGWCANFDRKQAVALVEQWFLEEGEEIEVILSNNDDMALGAADSMKKIGKVGCAIVGIDGTPEGRKAVDEGVLLGTIVSNQEQYAKEIFRLCKEVGRKDQDIAKNIDKYTWIPWEKYIQ